MSMPSVMEKAVTFTQTTDDGSVVVVTDVPATVIQLGESGEEVAFDLDVAERLEKLVSDALAAAPGPSAKHIFSWSNGPTLPPSDIEFRFSGPNTQYGYADIATWERVTKAIESAFRIVAKEIRRQLHTDVVLPRVAYVGSGSLRVGLRSRDYQQLFPGVTTGQDASVAALRVLAEAPLLLEGDATSSSHGLAWEPRLLHAALRALEVLTPSARDKNSTVEIIPSANVFPNVKRSTLHAGLIPDIRLRRKALAAEHEDKREITLDARIDSVSIDRQFHLREVEVFEGTWGAHSTAEVQFDEDMFDEVVQLFREKSRVRVHALQSIAPGADPRKLELIAVHITDGDESEAAH